MNRLSSNRVTARPPRLSGPARPRGLVGRSLVAVAVFAAAVVPGWTLGDLAERWTGNALLDWLITCGWCAGAVAVLGPRASYRRRDAALGLVPFLGWYLLALMAWRVALLPYRDWEPRLDELSRARWLTGDLVGFWVTGGPGRVTGGPGRVTGGPGRVTGDSGRVTGDSAR